MNPRRLLFTCSLAALALALTPALSPRLAQAAPGAAAADTPTVAVVRQYVAAHLAGKGDAAYALLSPDTQVQFPAGGREQLARDLTRPEMLKSLPPALLPVVALFADIHDTLHFKFRVLGASPGDPSVVLVRTYQVGTPAESVKVLKVATVSDPAAGGVIRVDGEKTMLLAAPEMAGMRAKAQQAASQSNLKQIALGIIQYTQDNDEHLPDADKWVDEIMPYVKSEAIFRDPSAPAGEKWSYAFNRTLSRAPVAQLDSPASTVMLFESSKGTKNASDTGESVPNPGRHSGGTDYALADGHVKWLADGTKLSYTLSGK